jgi:hypothetical protein
VLEAWASWTRTTPDEVTTSARILQLPPLPELPEPIRGRKLVVVDGAILGNMQAAASMLGKLRELAPEIDTFAPTPAPALCRPHGDPEEPAPYLSESAMLRELPAEAIEVFVKADLFAEAGVPTTFLRTAFYWDNLISLGMGLKRDADGRLAITFPLAEAALPSIAAEDIGRCAYGVFAGGSRWIGTTLGIAGEHVTGEEMATDLSAALGEQVRYDAVSPQEYRSLGFPGAEDLGNMFQFKVDFACYYRAARDLATSRELNLG